MAKSKKDLDLSIEDKITEAACKVFTEKGLPSGAYQTVSASLIFSKVR